MVVAAPKKPIHPALLKLGEERSRSFQNQVADAITRFAGSMWFAYLHIAWFSIWIAFGIERYPYGLLTMIVSLEAIFLSTFVMISQNRQDDARRHLADEEWRMVQSEERQNVELIALSNQILHLTDAIHRLTLAHTAAVDRPPSDPRERLGLRTAREEPADRPGGGHLMVSIRPARSHRSFARTECTRGGRPGQLPASRSISARRV